MIPDVLFWFYKDFDTCESRLRSLRSLNKTVRVYGLYAGPPSQAGEARERLEGWLDDFYAYTDESDAKWKWRNGDRVLAAWYRDRGNELEWETVFVLQWDMLLLASVETLFPTLRPDEILLSGLRPLGEIEDWWPWALRKNVKKRQDLEAFRTMLAEKFDYGGDLFACLFIVVCFPRLFMERYVAAGPPECGFLEYKVPTMAAVFGIPPCLHHHFDPWWAANPATKTATGAERTLNAVAEDVPLSVILKEAASPTGQRVFHPVRETVAEWKLRPAHARWLYRVYSCAEFIENVGRRVLGTGASTPAMRILRSVKSRSRYSP